MNIPPESIDLRGFFANRVDSSWTKYAGVLCRAGKPEERYSKTLHPSPLPRAATRAVLTGEIAAGLFYASPLAVQKGCYSLSNSQAVVLAPRASAWGIF